MNGEALWPYALEVYGRPGVEALLLELQDGHGQCISYLLWALWMAAQGRPAAGALAAGVRLARGWDAAALAPLRRLRAGLKRPAAGAAAPAWESLRGKVKGLELEAERMLLQMLEAASPPVGAAPADAWAGLGRAVAAWGVAAPPELLRRLAEAAA